MVFQIIVGGGGLYSLVGRLLCTCSSTQLVRTHAHTHTCIYLYLYTHLHTYTCIYTLRQFHSALFSYLLSFFTYLSISFHPLYFPLLSSSGFPPFYSIPSLHSLSHPTLLLLLLLSILVAYFTRLKGSMFVTYLLYFGYMGVISLAIFLITGTYVHLLWIT